MKSLVVKILIPVLSLFFALTVPFAVYAASDTKSSVSGGISYLMSPYVLPVDSSVTNADTSIVDTHGTVLQNISITLIENAVTITKISDMASNPINIVFIPSTMDIGNKTYPITKIGDGALKNIGAMTDLILSPNIKEIGSRQFTKKVTSLLRIIFLSDTPPLIGTNSLPENENYQYNVFVKESAYSAFSAAILGTGHYSQFAFLLMSLALDNANSLNGGTTANLTDDYGSTQKRIAIIEYNLKTDLFNLKQNRFLPGIKSPR